MKKWYLSVLLVLMMALGMSAPALAADEAPDAPVPVEAEPAAPVAVESESAADVPAVAAVTNGWVNEDGSWYYYKNGTMLQDYWLFGEGSANGLWYYLGKDGKMATGFQYVENPNGTGWFMFQDTNYNGCEGALLSGWQATGVAGTGWFETRHNGHFGECTWTSAWGDYDRSTNTWSNGGPSSETEPTTPPAATPDGEWYTDPHGDMFFYKNGKAVTGWGYIDGTYYYFDKKSGKMVVSSWIQDGNDWYFVGPDGKMMEGLSEINLGRSDDGWYYFNEEHDGSFGKVLTGWRQIDGVWYYFNPEHNGAWGRAYTGGWKWVNQKKYWFGDDGKMAANTFVPADWYGEDSDLSYTVYAYVDENGDVVHQVTSLPGEVPPYRGWYYDGADWYYYRDGRPVRGFYYENSGYVLGLDNGREYLMGGLYYFAEDGKMATGEIEYDGHILAFDNTGAVKTGLHQAGGNWYYLNLYKAGGNAPSITPGLEYITGWFNIDGKLYFFDPQSYAAATGQQTIGGYTYQFSSNGACVNLPTTTAGQDAMARQIARYIANNVTGSTDLERVTNAANIIRKIILNERYTTSGKYYSRAYGVFVYGEYSCAGSARAMGMVLEEMGFSWTHANPNLRTHQWCELKMDGKKGWADPAIPGVADYGAYPDGWWVE